MIIPDHKRPVFMIRTASPCSSLWTSSWTTTIRHKWINSISLGSVTELREFVLLRTTSALCCRTATTYFSSTRTVGAHQYSTIAHRLDSNKGDAGPLICGVKTAADATVLAVCNVPAVDVQRATILVMHQNVAIVRLFALHYRQYRFYILI